MKSPILAIATDGKEVQTSLTPTRTNGNSEIISLYFHIPFCKQKCDYCHFYTIPAKTLFFEQYMQGLKTHFQRWSPIIQSKKICSIYFGGGTPSLLGPKNIETILAWAKNSGALLTPDIEITLEANPEGITSDLMSAYASIGINRASIGVQTFDDKLLGAISRRHTAKEAEEAILATQDSGITNISIDLMYDLPGQTLSIWEETLQKALGLPITHLSLYNLVIEQHSVFYKKKKALQKLMPDADTSLGMYKRVIEVLGNEGWKQYEISAFQKEGHISKHNTGYWTGRSFLGFGPSAFSYWEGKRFRNTANLNRYTKALQEGKNPVDFEEALPPDAGRKELLAINLRLLEGLDLDRFKREHGNLDGETQDIINHLIKKKLLKQTDSHLSLTNRGLLLYDAIAAELI